MGHPSESCVCCPYLPCTLVGLRHSFPKLHFHVDGNSFLHNEIALEKFGLPRGCTAAPGGRQNPMTANKNAEGMCVPCFGTYLKALLVSEYPREHLSPCCNCIADKSLLLERTLLSSPQFTRSVVLCVGRGPHYASCQEIAISEAVSQRARSKTVARPCWDDAGIA